MSGFNRFHDSKFHEDFNGLTPFKEERSKTLPVEQTADVDSVDTAATLHETRMVESRHCVPEDSPDYTITPIDLPTACKLVEWNIQSKDLGQAIAELQTMKAHVFLLDHLYRAFSDTLTGFRKLDVQVVWLDEVLCVFLPLRASLKLLGIAFPEIPDGADYCTILWNFCEKHGVSPWDIVFSQDEEDYYVRSDHLCGFVQTEWHPEIVKRFECWLSAFTSEKTASAPWCCLRFEDANYFPLEELPPFFPLEE